MNFKVAIDGPAGSGKSTISKIVASKIGFIHIDTGAMYRAIALEAIKRGIDINDEKEYSFLDQTVITYDLDKVFLNGVDVSKKIRSKEVTKIVSSVAKLPVVRDKLKILQQKAALNTKCIMDGRDIGYNVLPDANLKIFLVASIDERTRRRQKENEANGDYTSFEEIKADMIKRDYEDSNRLASPLKKADDAIVIDTTEMSIEKVVNKIIELVNERMN